MAKPRIFLWSGALLMLLFFSRCGNTDSTTNPKASDNSVIMTAKILDLTRVKFIELALMNLESTPQQVLAKTIEWLKAQSSVQHAYLVDSTYIEIIMKSGLQTTFGINLMDTDSISISRSGGLSKINAPLKSTGKSKNTINNKNVLIFAPFVECGGSLYKSAELFP